MKERRKTEDRVREKEKNHEREKKMIESDTRGRSP